jgi:CDP-paratose 2-epimerase
MRILVTGGCGFIGSHICEFYAERGDDVLAFDNLTKHELRRTGYDVQAARQHILGFLRQFGVKIAQADIRNEDELWRASEGCDYIIHTAAQPAMTISIENPELDLTTNVVGTFNVLEIARRRDLPIAMCSTIHVYGNKINETIREGEARFLREPAAIDENHATMEGAITPLHASKRTGELYAQAFLDTYGLRVAVFRLTGIYGPRQFGGEDHGWVANFTVRTLLGSQITVFGSGKQVRDILYASDAARAFDAFYKRQDCGIYNIGGGSERAISLIECIQLIEQISGKKAQVAYAPKRKGDLWYFVCNTAMAREKMGWQPETSNEEGLRKLVGWVQSSIEIFRGVQQ